jgi:cystathionine beta-lyase
MKRLYGWQVEPDMVVATPGIVSGFNIAAHAYCSPGSGILMHVPVYYPFLALENNVGIITQTSLLVPKKSSSNLYYEIDFDGFKSRIHLNSVKTQMFLLCNPHNPTGKIFHRDELLKFAEICLENGIIICSDEIHSELILGDRQHIPLATLSPEIANRTITLVSPSKTFNVPGLFCGLAIIPDPELRDRFKKQVDRLTLHVNSLGIVAAQTAFSGVCDEWLIELRSYLRANRDFLTEYIRGLLPGIQTTKPDATYLSWLDCNELISEGRIEGSPYEFFLKEAKVALNDGTVFGPGGQGFVRLNFGCPRSTLEEALSRMKQALLKKKSRSS